MQTKVPRLALPRYTRVALARDDNSWGVGLIVAAEAATCYKARGEERASHGRGRPCPHNLAASLIPIIRVMAIDELAFRRAAEAALEELKNALIAAEESADFEVEEQGGVLN